MGGDEPAKEEEAAFRLVPRELVSLKQQRINSISTQISPLIPDLKPEGGRRKGSGAPPVS